MRTLEDFEKMLNAFLNSRAWGSEEPENNRDWQDGFNSALECLREELRPWYPFGGPLDLAALVNDEATRDACAAIAKNQALHLTQLAGQHGFGDAVYDRLMTRASEAYLIADSILRMPISMKFDRTSFGMGAQLGEPPVEVDMSKPLIDE